MSKERDKRKLTEIVRPKRKQHDEKHNPLDQFEDQKFVDDIPLEDLKIEAEQEKDKHKTQNKSQSEQKYKTNTN